MPRLEHSARNLLMAQPRCRTPLGRIVPFVDGERNHASLIGDGDPGPVLGCPPHQRGMCSASGTSDFLLVYAYATLRMSRIL